MKRILLIKLTSFGDLIHAFPALNDAYRADPTIEFDWAIDSQFAEVAAWHPAVKQIFCTSHRQWKKNLASRSTYSNIHHFLQNLRKTSYDLIIDAQGNFKTALLTRLAKGAKAGFDRHSAREWIAHLGYEKKIEASKQAHAIDRLRILFSEAIGYPLSREAPDFRFKEGSFAKPPFDLPSRYLVFVHNATWATKLWSEEHWKELIRQGIDSGFQILLPWGSLEEKERALRLAIAPEAIVLPKLSLSCLGYILKQAKGAVCMDTGLSHLAAALGVPAVTLYGATDLKLIGTCGENQFRLFSNLSCAPCGQKKCRFNAYPPPCLTQILPEEVFHRLLETIQESRSLKLI